MENAQIEVLKHLWMLNYKTLGIGKSLVRLWKNKYKFLIATSIYGWIMFSVTEDVFFSFLPFFLYLILMVGIVVDLVYTSRKCVDILYLANKYVSHEIDMYELLFLMKEDNFLKDDIWF
jgi:hypothetical protein